MSHRQVTRREVVEVMKAYDASKTRSNQETLGSGCVCSHGCDSCDRLAEAWEAMREALASTIDTLNLHDTGEQVFGAAYPDSRADCLRRVRAALELARRVSE